MPGATFMDAVEPERWPTGCPRSPARWTTTRECPVTSSLPRKTRISSVSSWPVCSADSARASRHRRGMAAILPPNPEPNEDDPAIVDASMDVYLVPVGAERYELYCEISDEPETRGEADPPRNRFRRLVDRFNPRRLVDRFKQMIA